MIDVKRARTRILSLAYSGNLTPDWQECTTNSELESLHHRLKKFEPVSEAEKLTETPEHWIWSRLGYVTANHGQMTPDSTFCYVDVGTLDNIHNKLSRNENIIEANDAPSRAKKVIKNGDVIYSTVRPYLHNICIVDKEFSHTPIASTAFCVMAVNETILLNKYLFYWLLTSEFDSFANGNPSKGTLYPAIGEKALLNGVIPIPSLEEQVQIVELITQAFAELQRIEDAQIGFANDMHALRGKVIDAGIRGLLTEQRQEDGNALDLIDVMAARKREEQKTIRAKKSTELPSVSADDIPFTIPENWTWLRFGNAAFIVRGGSPRPIKSYVTDDENGINWIKIGDVEKGGKYIYQTKERIIPEGEKKSRRVAPGDFLLTNSMSFGRPYISMIDGCIHDGWLLIRNLGGFDIDYLYYLLSSSYMYDQFCQKASGSTVDNLNIDKVSSALIPLPPLAEQERIARRIEELLDALPE